MATGYIGGAHADSEAGPIDVGLAITSEAMGLTVDAPQLGQLRAAFAVLRDGTTRLTALSRRTAEGIDTPILGLNDESRLARLHFELDAREGELRAIEARAQTLEEALAEERKQSSATQDELKQTQSSLQTTEQRRSAADTTLGEVRGRLAQTQIELRAARTDAAQKLAAAAAELAGLTDRFEQSERLLSQANAHAAQLGQQLAVVQGEAAAQTERANGLEADRDETMRRLALSEEARHADAERAAAVAAQLEAVEQRAAVQELELKELRATSAQRLSEL